MIKDEAFPLTAFQSPPSSPEEATERVSVLVSYGYLTGMVGAVFHDDLQLQRAMRECGYNMAPGKVLMDSGRVKTLKSRIVDRHGNAYDMITNALGEHWLSVVNVKLVEAGSDPDHKRKLDELFSPALSK